MNFPAIKKAKYLYYSGLVHLDTVGLKDAWFTIDNHCVSLKYGKGQLEMHCDCKFEANKGIPKRSLCSHIIAAILYISGKEGKLKKEGIL